MLDQFTDLLHAAVTSPWAYLTLFVVAAVDGFFPLVPGETLVITAGVFAASTGEPGLVMVVGSAALGAFVGDHVSYALGRGAGGRLLAHLPTGSRKRDGFDRAGRALAERGGLAVVVCRYVPGLRTSTTIMLGTLRYPRGPFAFFAAIAALSWAVYSALIGFLGGVAFERQPLKGLVLGLGIALSVTVIVEVVRHLRRRSGSGREEHPEALSQIGERPGR